MTISECARACMELMILWCDVNTDCVSDAHMYVLSDTYVQHMHTCMHAYTHACIYTFIRTHTHVYTHKYISYIHTDHTYISIYIHSYIYAYIHTYIHITHTYVHTFIHPSIHTYIHKCTHTDTHTPTHIHTYIHVNLPLKMASAAIHHSTNRQQKKALAEETGVRKHEYISCWIMWTRIHIVLNNVNTNTYRAE